MKALTSLGKITEEGEVLRSRRVDQIAQASPIVQAWAPKLRLLADGCITYGRSKRPTPVCPAHLLKRPWAVKASKREGSRFGTWSGSHRYCVEAEVPHLRSSARELDERPQ